MASDITINQLLAMQHEQSLGIQRQNAEAFAALNVQMNRVGTSLLTQKALANVSDFSEKDNLRSWLSEIEKSRAINGLSKKRHVPTSLGEIKRPCIANVGTETQRKSRNHMGSGEVMPGERIR